MSETDQSLSHSKWNCKYHIVFVPKRRRKALFGQVRKQLGAIFHALAKQKECQIIEGHLMPDHVHICIAIPPKHAVSSVIGFLKGKSAIAVARRKARNAISRGNIFGHGVTPSRREASSWNKSANTSASRMRRMAKLDNSELNHRRAPRDA